MWSIETQSIILVILMVLFFSLGWIRSQLFQRATEGKEPFPQLTDLTVRTTALIYLVLLSGTWLLMFLVALMFSLAPIIQWQTLFAVGLPLILSFFIIVALQRVLSLWRQYKQLPISLWVDFSVLWMVCLISTVELSFLYWMKEVTIYFFSPPFLTFVGLYSLLILGVASVLSLSPHDKRFLKNREFVSVAVLDSVLITLSTTIFLQIILTIIYLFN